MRSTMCSRRHDIWIILPVNVEQVSGRAATKLIHRSAWKGRFCETRSISRRSPPRVSRLRALGRDAGSYILLWWINMCKCEYSGRAGGLTREFRNTRPPRLCFRALLTEGGERKVSPCSWVFSGYCFPTLEARNQVNSRSRCLASRGP
jgi:hypothetical protein